MRAQDGGTGPELGPRGLAALYPWSDSAQCRSPARGGATELTAYLIFDGGLDAYAEILGGTITAEMPHPDNPQRLANRRLEIGDQVLHGMDSPQPGGARPSQSMLVLDTAAEAERVFAALTQDGQVAVPIGPALFADRFGMGTDRFGAQVCRDKR